MMAAFESARRGITPASGEKSIAKGYV